MLLGEVVDVDLEARTVTSDVLGRKTVTPYDSLIVAAGAAQSYFGNDHFAEDAPGMKSIDDALELRGRIFGAFEMAELGASRGEDVDHLLTFVVVGAGPTGVEMAGQIAELAHRTLKRDFRAINTRSARVILLDAAPQVLPPFGKKLGEHTQKALEKLGVEVILGGMVTDVDERGIDVAFKDGRNQRIVAVTKIWAAGVQASPLGRTLAEQTGAPLDRAGRIGVNPDLTLPGPSRGVRGRRHDRPRQPPRRRPGGHPGSQVRRQVDRAPDLGQAAAAAVQVLRQGFDGDDQPLQSGGPDRQDPADRLRRLGGVAGAAPHLHHRVQEPAHRADALVRLVPGPRALGADHHRAADLRAGSPAATARRRGRPGVAPGAYDRAQEILEVTRRAELEARALEEARLTDSGERGQHQEQRA